MFVLEEGSGRKELKRNVVTEGFVLLEEGVDLFVVLVAKIALPKEVEGSEVVV